MKYVIQTVNNLYYITEHFHRKYPKDWIIVFPMDDEILKVFDPELSHPVLDVNLFHMIFLHRKDNYFVCGEDFEDGNAIEKLLENQETSEMGVMLIRHQIEKKQNNY